MKTYFIVASKEALKRNDSGKNKKCRDLSLSVLN